MSLRLEMPRTAEGEVRVVDLAGRSVRTLHRGALSVGVLEMERDGRDDRGRETMAGVYLVQARAGDGNAVARVTLIR